MKVHLKCSKTDSFKEGMDIVLAHMNDELCPVAAMLSWLVLRAKKMAPCLNSNREPHLPVAALYHATKGH